MNTVRKISFTFAALLCCSLARGKTPVLLSTDIGNEIDDQWAVAYLLTSPEFDVQGIVSAHAPTLPAPAAHFTYRALIDEVEHQFHMSVHPPLLEGASLPLTDGKTPQPSAGLDFILQASKSFSQNERLNVVVIGAATDVASAILSDPSITGRINVVAMGFKNLGPSGGEEYNVQNDPKAWQVILRSGVPLTIGSGDVCRANLALSFQEAALLLSGHGPIASWLWQEYQVWYFQHVKPLRVNDFSQPWIIWDIITLAHLKGMTTAKQVSRPALGNDLSFRESDGGGTISWIENVDSKRLWRDFIDLLDVYTRTHALEGSE